MGGIPVFVLLALLFTSVQGNSAFSDWWLSYWSMNADDRPLSFWLSVYLGSSLAGALMLLCRALLFAVAGVHASAQLHRDLASKVLTSPPRVESF